ncbi:MAG: hypothetical protein JWM05_1679 [Acidimicrobiales bacterium]|nr:hypothetical protein [Acidimicrobiales bacterium]
MGRPSLRCSPVVAEPPRKQRADPATRRPTFHVEQREAPLSDRPRKGAIFAREAARWRRRPLRGPRPGRRRRHCAARPHDGPHTASARFGEASAPVRGGCQLSSRGRAVESSDRLRRCRHGQSVPTMRARRVAAGTAESVAHLRNPRRARGRRCGRPTATVNRAELPAGELEARRLTMASPSAIRAPPSSGAMTRERRPCPSGRERAPRRPGRVDRPAVDPPRPGSGRLGARLSCEAVLPTVVPDRPDIPLLNVARVRSTASPSGGRRLGLTPHSAV